MVTLVFFLKHNHNKKKKGTQIYASTGVLKEFHILLSKQLKKKKNAKSPFG